MTEYEQIEKLHNRWKAKMDSMPIDSPLYDHNSGIETGLGLALGTFQKPSNTALKIDAKSSFKDHIKKLSDHIKKTFPSWKRIF